MQSIMQVIGTIPLPDIRDYVIRRYAWGPERLDPGKTKTLLSRSFTGYLVFAYLWADNPDITLLVDLYGDGSVEIALNPRKLYEDNLVWPSPGSAWVSRYDPTNNIYVALYTPSPWLAWSGNVRVDIKNPSATVGSYKVITWLYERIR